MGRNQFLWLRRAEDSPNSKLKGSMVRHFCKQKIYAIDFDKFHINCLVKHKGILIAR